jgi:hypothetical protein
MTEQIDSEAARQIMVERYKYILDQIKSTNDNVYRFLAIYQALATAIAGAGMLLFVNYRNWKVPPAVVRLGLEGAASILSVVAGFTILLILIGVWTWLDYRNEECDVADRIVGVGFRSRPKVGNFFRWYETYIVVFIGTTVVVVWVFVEALLVPAVR